MCDESNHESIETNPSNTQSLSPKQKNVPQKSLRVKQLRNNLTNSSKRRSSILNKVFVSRDDSLIRVDGHNHRSKSVKSKSDDIITINVSGNRYQTRLSTFESYPNTLLGNKQKRKYYWNKESKEYFFDRHRGCFEAILYYYQSNGRLRRPNYVPLDTFFEEISFFDLGPEAISQINKLENVSIIKYIDLPNWRWRRYIWFYLEYPQNSIFGRIIHFISMFLTILSCITLAIETLPEYKQKSNHLCLNNDQNSTLLINDILICSSRLSSPFFVIQRICVSYFTLEFLLRLISTPSYYRFILSITNWIDLCAIVPYFVFLGIGLDQKESNLNERYIVLLSIIRILGFLRVFKIDLIFKQFKSLRVLSSTLKESFKDFIIMIIILTFMAFLFGSALYFAEQNINGQVFDSIPAATYWGIITITTVGYGDMYPVTVIGRILTCMCAFFGVATSAMLVSVLVDRYQRVYNRKQYFPEQFLSVIDSSDGEQEGKQDFLNRKLSSTRKTLTSRTNLPIKPAPPLIFTKNHRTSGVTKGPSSYVRFIITLPEDQTNNKLIHQTANELMKQLREIIENTGDRINFKLISTETNSLNGRSSITNQLSSIFEE